MSEVTDTYNHIEELISERNELQRKLGISLKINELWPGCFDYGKVKASITGSYSRGFHYNLRRGDGAVRSWKLQFDAPKQSKQDKKAEFAGIDPSSLPPVLVSDVVPRVLIDSVLDYVFGGK